MIMNKDAFFSSPSSKPPGLEKNLPEKQGLSLSPKSCLERLSLPREAERPEPLSVSPDNPKSGKYQRVFRYFDKDQDGRISPAELCACLGTLKEEISLEEAEAVVKSADSDGDGLLSLEEFVGLVEVDGEEEKKKDLREAFGMYEMDGCGCITPKSLKRMLSRLGESKTTEECTAMISRFDLNGDGVLSFDEFVVMMK